MGSLALSKLEDVWSLSADYQMLQGIWHSTLLINQINQEFLGEATTKPAWNPRYTKNSQSPNCRISCVTPPPRKKSWKTVPGSTPWSWSSCVPNTILHHLPAWVLMINAPYRISMARWSHLSFEQQLDHLFAGFVRVSLVTEPGTHHAQMSHPLCSGSGSTQGDWMYSKSVVPNGVNDTQFSHIKERISASSIVDKHQQANKKTDVTFHEHPGLLQGSFYYPPKQYTSIHFLLWANHSKWP